MKKPIFLLVLLAVIALTFSCQKPEPIDPIPLIEEFPEPLAKPDIEGEWEVLDVSNGWTATPHFDLLIIDSVLNFEVKDTNNSLLVSGYLEDADLPVVVTEGIDFDYWIDFIPQNIIDSSNYAADLVGFRRQVNFAGDTMNLLPNAEDVHIYHLGRK